MLKKFLHPNNRSISELSRLAMWAKQIAMPLVLTVVVHGTSVSSERDTWSNTGGGSSCYGAKLYGSKGGHEYTYTLGDNIITNCHPHRRERDYWTDFRCGTCPHKWVTGLEIRHRTQHHPELGKIHGDENPGPIRNVTITGQYLVGIRGRSGMYLDQLEIGVSGGQGIDWIHLGGTSQGGTPFCAVVPDGSVISRIYLNWSGHVHGIQIGWEPISVFHD